MVNKCAKNRIYPAITYWIATQSPNGAPVDALEAHRALVHCDVEVNSTRASAKKGGCEILNKLCQLLKDHKNNFMWDLTAHSRKWCMKTLYEELTNGETLEESITELERVVRLVVVRPGDLHASLKRVANRLKDVGLEFDFMIMNEDDKTSSSLQFPKKLGEPITVLINDVERIMKKLNFGYKEGDIFKRHITSRYTYTRLCSMDTFLNSLLGNSHFKDRLLTHMAKLQSVLKHPDCQAIPQLDIETDLVEVKLYLCTFLLFKAFILNADSLLVLIGKWRLVLVVQSKTFCRERYIGF